MSAFDGAQGDRVLAAEALMAFRSGDDSEMAEVGALLIADIFDCWRTVRNALTKT